MNYRRRWVIGDIHGNIRGLKQVLERAEVDKERDLVITLGDICDGFKYVYECVEELLTIKNRIDIKGNHDEWFFVFLNTGINPDQWRQGGLGTLQSYLRNTSGLEDHVIRSTYSTGYISPLLADDVPVSHWKFFAGQHLYYKDEDGKLFVHGGFNRNEQLVDIKANNPMDFYWNRGLIGDAINYQRRGSKLLFVDKSITEVFLGHTGTQYWDKDEPIHADIIWNVDTGGGNLDGTITIMDIDSKEFFQSDKGSTLYPEGGGR